MFSLTVVSKRSKARIGTLSTSHGNVPTPCFMPIATKGAVKTLAAGEVKDLGADILLSNTFHLSLRPGIEQLKKLGGLHRFMNWQKPILTDSGGYQVFSLSAYRKITDNGVAFQSPVDGRKMELTPETVIDIQQVIGSDIMMVLDECVGYPCLLEKAKEAMERTNQWAERAKRYWEERKGNSYHDQLLFAIMQGGTDIELRKRSADCIVQLDFPGYAIGGLAVGEPMEAMYENLDHVVDFLPATKPRYLMGVGYPENIVEAVKRGVDMFDCVIPTREARHGKIYQFTKEGEGVNLWGDVWYQSINVINERYGSDESVINNQSGNELLKNHSFAYLRHLFQVEEPLAQRLATINNVEFYLLLMERIKGAIREGIL
ncbi:MAG: tRNA guanosine(34) transglycosylase Tgt [bacterium]